MRRTLALAVALFAGLVLPMTMTASAATPTEKKLQRQVTALQKQVKKLQKQVTQAEAAASAALVFTVCSTAATSDALQGTWAAINTREASRGGPPVFAAETAVNDAGACSRLRVTRAPTANPPNLTPFKSLLALLTSFF